MIPNLILNALECALQNKKCKHYIVNPITMQCGHTACKACIISLEKQNIVKCLTCGQLNEVDIKKNGESYIVKCVVKTYIQDLFSVIYSEMKASIETLRDTLGSFDKRLEEHIDYLQDEIELRIAFVRIELDELSQAFKDELNDFKMKIKSRYSEINIDIEQNELENLKNIIEKEKLLNEDSLREYQIKIQNLNNLIEELKFKDDLITFNESTSIIDKSLIGSLNLNYPYRNNNEEQDRNLIECLKTSPTTLNYKFIGLSPNSLFKIDHGNTLAVVYNDKFELYDQNLNLIKTIETIGKKKIKINCCKAVSNNVNRIYLCEHNSHKLRVLDFNFNEIDTSTTIATTRQKQLYYPYDLAYHNDGYLYVCDLRNRIVKCKENNASLEYVLEHKVNFQIRQMLITADNQCLCLNTFNFDKIYFLSSNTFQTLNVYESASGGPICELDSYIYEFTNGYGNINNKHITYFDSKGSLVEKYKTKANLKHFTFNSSVCMIRFASKFIITSSCGKLLSI